MEEARQPLAEPPRDASAMLPHAPPTTAADAAPPAPHPALATAAQAAAREFLASPERAVHVPPAPSPAAASHHLDSTPPPAPPVHASATLATAAQAAARSMSAAPAPAATGAGSFDANAVTDSVIRELRRQQDAARELLDHDVAPANHRDGAPTPSVDSDSDSDSDSGDDEDAMDVSTPPPPTRVSTARSDGRGEPRQSRRARADDARDLARCGRRRRVDQWRTPEVQKSRYVTCGRSTRSQRRSAQPHAMCVVSSAEARCPGPDGTRGRAPRR